MQCPFLQETRVGRCSCSSQRKMIARAATAIALEKCSSPEFVTCGIYQQHAVEAQNGAKCPFLDESPVQYCSAASVVKYIPYTEALLSRCGSDAYRYCDLHLALSRPGTHPEDQWVGDVRLAANLLYTRNHLWFDPGAGETWHVGIDAFLAKVLSRVDQISFLTPGGLRRPAAVFTTHGVDLQVVFPELLPITATHTYLRAKPSALTEDPYGQGWLFEGTPADPANLMKAPEAAQSTARDAERLSVYVHNYLARTEPAFAADGGEFSNDLLSHLGHDQVLALFHEFFSPESRGDMR